MIAGRLAALATALAVLASAPLASTQAQDVRGAGSTLAFPVLSRWSQAYQRAQSDADFQPVGAGLDYEPVGSQAGVERLREASVDFGATDEPLSQEELARSSFAQFPVVIGGVIVAVNVPGVASGAMRLTGEVLADIYLGKVRAWSDPAIRALNPGLSLPDAPIVALRRTDGSGTTFTFTNYLSKVSPGWRTQVGQGQLVAWPASDRGAKGNDGLAAAIKQTPNAIGYVDFAQAQRAGLNHALLRNHAGAFVAPGAAGFQSAAESAGWGTTAGFKILLTDAPGDAAYPIVATTYVVMPRRSGAASRSRAVIEFLRWSLDNGARAATELGYVPLPPGAVAQVKRYWTANF